MISTSYSPSCQGTASWFSGVGWGAALVKKWAFLHLTQSKLIRVSGGVSESAFWIITSGWGWCTRQRRQPLCQMKGFIILVSWWTLPGCLLDTGTLIKRWDNGKSHPWALEGFLLCERDYLSWIYMKGSEGDVQDAMGVYYLIKGQ